MKHLTVEDFLDIGVDQLAYIRDIAIEESGDTMYVIYGADGSQISVMDSYDTALAAIHINNLFPVTLH